MRTNEEIIDIVIDICNKNDISQSELARRVGMAKSAISRYFNKTREFPLNRADEFAIALGIDTSFLLGVDKKGGIKLNKNEEKLLDNYNKLNDLGQKEAIKRVSELTEIDKYTIRSQIITMAAHNDDTSEEQIKLMKKDFEEMDKW